MKIDIHCESLFSDDPRAVCQVVTGDAGAIAMPQTPVMLVVIDECSFVDRRVGEDLESFGIAALVKIRR